MESKYWICEINGKKYYFYETGWPFLRRDGTVSENGTAYVCGEDGVLIELLDNQWTFVNGYYYYAQNGEAITSRIVQINGKYYGFSSNGRMYADTIFDNEGKEYYAKADGSLCENEWCYEWRYVHGWMYCGSDRTYYKDGIYEINNTLYYFDKYGTMATSGVYTLNGENYVAQADGSLIKTPENGWFLSERKILLCRKWRSCKEKNN